jgi:hypothetical protein
MIPCLPDKWDSIEKKKRTKKEKEEEKEEENKNTEEREAIITNNRYKGHILTDKQLKEIEVFQSKTINLDGECKSILPASVSHSIYDDTDPASLREDKDLYRDPMSKLFSNPFSDFKESDHNKGADEQQMEELKKEFKSKADDICKRCLSHAQDIFYDKLLHHKLIVETSRNKEGYKCKQGLTEQKVSIAIQHLDNNKVPKDDRYAVVTTKQWRDLLKVPSFEAAEEKDGRKTWKGVTFIWSDEVKECFMYHTDYLNYTLHITKPRLQFYTMGITYIDRPWNEHTPTRRFSLGEIECDMYFKIDIDSRGFVKMPCSTDCDCC